MRPFCYHYKLARRAPGQPQSATRGNRRLHGYQRYFIKFKMAQLNIRVHELVQNYIDKADDRSLTIEISNELLQLTRVVIKKDTLPGEKAFKYHLSQLVDRWFTGTKSSYRE